ncbi:MAG: rSAM-modified peptide [Chitinophagaceae bacterium]|nr:MAG: rSAM-modified peptide [Chitinophagaceae bacterium]
MFLRGKKTTTEIKIKRMKKSNELSKAEMKKVIGGHEDTPYCMAGNPCHYLEWYSGGTDSPGNPGNPIEGTCLTRLEGTTVFCGCSSAPMLTSDHRKGDGCWGVAPIES